ncbi:MAG: methyltransferase domain-containing protein [Streptosporangiaceae bacterium]
MNVIDLSHFEVADEADSADLIRYLEAASSLPGVRGCKQAATAELRLRPGHSVLDVGCGYGADVLAMARRVGPAGRAVGVDLSQNMIGEARQRGTGLPVTFETADARGLRFAGATFDACRAERLLQHVPDPSAAAGITAGARASRSGRKTRLRGLPGRVRALALENARLQAALAAQIEEARASRARIVQAGLDERRKVERDLHDGAQQRLLALSLTIAMIGDQLAAAPRPDPGLSRLAGTARGQIRAAIAELRELSRGIHPAVLASEGLAAAAETLAALAPLPVTTAIDPARYPAAAEAAAYFLIAEALANIARHARATRARVTAGCGGGLLAVEIADDGIGGASARDGTGLTGLADRIAALGGQLTITSPPGHGTAIRASLPCS